LSTELYVVRCANLLLYISIIYLAITIAPRFKWLLGATALLPTALFQASIVSADPVVNAISFLLIALLLNLWERKEQMNLLLNASIIVLASILAVTKQPYLLLGALFFMLPSTIYTSKIKANLWKTLYVAVPLMVGLIWTRLNSNLTNDVMKTYSHINFSAQENFVLHHPLSFLATFVRTYYYNIDNMFASMSGWIGDRAVGLPILILAALTVLIILTASLIQKPSKRDVSGPTFNNVVTFFVLAGIISGVSLGLYLGFTPLASPLIGGIQGRYFIPLIPLAAIFIAGPLPLAVPAKSVTTARNLVIATSIFFLASTSLLYALVNF
jgi:uncharacterized membrane protein